MAKIIERCLSALATAWVIMFFATSGLAAALAMEAVWDTADYAQTAQIGIAVDPQ
jgi:hypothetical protein